MSIGQVGGQRLGLGSEGRHADLVEDGIGRDERGHRQGRRRRHAPAVGAGCGSERLGHLEPRSQIVAPPARQSRRGGRRVAFVDEHLGERTGTAVQVLVRAPGGEVDVPVVERERDVAGGMGEVPARQGADRMDRAGQAGDVHDLAGGVVDAGDERHRQPIAMPVDGGLDVLGPQGGLAWPRPDDDEVGGRIETVQPKLRVDGIPVRGKRRGVDEDRRAPCRPDGRRTPGACGGCTVRVFIVATSSGPAPTRRDVGPWSRSSIAIQPTSGRN